MTDEDRVRNELEELAKLEQRILAADQGVFVSPDSMGALGQWKARAISLLRPFDGRGAFVDLIEAARPPAMPGVPRIWWVDFATAKGAVQGFKAQFEAGLLSDVRLRVTADVFEDFLGQAEYLHAQSYHVAAASVSGAVLEEALRRLMTKHSLPPLTGHSNLGQLDGALAKAGVYSASDHTNVDRWRKIRNDADHGTFANVQALDVKHMIEGVREFIVRKLT